MRKRKRRSTAPKDELIEYGKKWLNAAWDGKIDKALEAREDAEDIFSEHPEYLEEPPYCKKMLFIHWQWFCHYLKPEVRDRLNELIHGGKMPNAFADPDDF